MKSLNTSLALFAAASLFISLHAGAQSKPANVLQPPPANIKVDGDIKEWGDSLRYYNTEKRLNYSLANDNENLYMAIRVNDRTEQMRILNAGLTLSINTKGKKKETFSITFPVGEPGAPAAVAPGIPPPDGDRPSQDDRDEMMRAKLTRLRNIKVVGFPDIEGDMITTSNTYGIQTAINYDDDGYLVYEAAIPLKFFHAEAPDKNEWAFNFKINGIEKPEHKAGGDDQGGGMGGGGRGGMGGGGMGGGGGRGGHGGGGGGRGGRGGGQQGSADHSEMAKSVDFWEKFYIAPTH